MCCKTPRKLTATTTCSDIGPLLTRLCSLQNQRLFYVRGLSIRRPPEQLKKQISRLICSRQLTPVHHTTAVSLRLLHKRAPTYKRNCELYKNTQRLYRHPAYARKQTRNAKCFIIYTAWHIYRIQALHKQAHPRGAIVLRDTTTDTPCTNLISNSTPL